MYVCIRGVNFASFYDFSIGFGSKKSKKKKRSRSKSRYIELFYKGGGG
jgi:hypothetical protein